MIDGLYGKRLEKHLGLAKSSSLFLTAVPGRRLVLSRIVAPEGLDGPTRRVQPERAHSISVHLRRPATTAGWGSWIGGTFRPVTSWELGGMEMFDLQADPIALRPSSFESVHIHLPQETIQSYCDECNEAMIPNLKCTPGLRDDTIFRWVKMLLPFFGEAHRLPTFAIDELVLLFCSYTFKQYGRSPVPEVSTGGLAHWQQRRATRLISENLNGDLGLTELASACGLSPSHFARAFRRSFGIPAHQYLIQRRIEQAKAMIQYGNLPLKQVALECGFVDQPALNRSFRAVVGTTPGTWKRHNRTAPVSLYWHAPLVTPEMQSGQV